MYFRSLKIISLSPKKINKKLIMIKSIKEEADELLDKTINVLDSIGLDSKLLEDSKKR